MAEHQFYSGDLTPHVSTFEFHKDRERAPHAEQPWHSFRMKTALEFVGDAVNALERNHLHQRFVPGLIDLGCGDGGFLQMVRNHLPLVRCRGYDFQPSNVDGWRDRKLSYVQQLDIVEQWDDIFPAHIYVITEVLEHLADPHQMVRRIRERGAYVVASSPCNETLESHDECHAWAWDIEGYKNLFTMNGFSVKRSRNNGQFHVILGEPK